MKYRASEPRRSIGPTSATPRPRLDLAFLKPTYREKNPMQRWLVQYHDWTDQVTGTAPNPQLTRKLMTRNIEHRRSRPLELLLVIHPCIQAYCKARRRHTGRMKWMCPPSGVLDVSSLAGPAASLVSEIELWTIVTTPTTTVAPSRVQSRIEHLLACTRSNPCYARRISYTVTPLPQQKQSWLNYHCSITITLRR